jgi:nucleoside-diphosphate-sugar epimerase
MVLVTGGTGMLGSHLLLHLLRQNDEIKAIKRKNSDLTNIKKIFEFYNVNYEEIFDKIHWIDADIENFTEIFDAFENVDFVYHTAAAVSFNPADKTRLKNTNVVGTANIVNAALKQNVKKLCYVSTVAFLNPLFENEIVDENFGRKPKETDSDYSKTKYSAELEVWRGVSEGLNAVIVNPSIILGPGNWTSGSPQFFSRINIGLKYYTDGISGFVDVNDVAKIMILLMDGDIHSERFILNSENLSYKDVFEQIAVSIEKKTPQKHINKNFLNTLSIIDTFISKIILKSPKIPRSAINSAFSKTLYSSKKLNQTIDFDFLPIQTSIRNTGKLFLKSKQ